MTPSSLRLYEASNPKVDQILDHIKIFIFFPFLLAGRPSIELDFQVVATFNMWFSKGSSGKYSALNKYDTEECELGDTNSSLGKSENVKRHTCCFSGACLFLLLVLVGLNVFNIGQKYWPQMNRHTAQQQSETSCQNPSIRREWRSLSMKEKHEYLQAVQCLSHTPSRLTSNMTLYDDFPHVHDTTGAFCECQFS